MVLQSLLKRITKRNFRGIARQTEKLDSDQRRNLAEFLEDIPEERQELEELEGELQQAISKLEELEQKEQFIGTRLRAYQQKLTQLPPPSSAISDAASNDDDQQVAAAVDQEQTQAVQSRKHQEQLDLLKTVEQTHQNMTASIGLLTEKILKMEKRKFELQYHVDQCQVALNTATALEKRETELHLEEVTHDIEEAARQQEQHQQEDTDNEVNSRFDDDIEETKNEDTSENDEELGEPLPASSTEEEPSDVDRENTDGQQEGGDEPGVDCPEHDDELGSTKTESVRCQSYVIMHQTNISYV